MDLVKDLGNSINPPGTSYSDGTNGADYISSVNYGFTDKDLGTVLGKNATANYDIFGNEPSIGFNLNPVDKLDEYIQQGGTPSKALLSANMNKLLADGQSTFSKWTNAIGQTLVSEIGLGTLKGVSDLVDFVGQSIGVSDGDYSNPVSQFLEQQQENFKNWAPVYVDPDKNISNGGLLDAGWWASNMPSIASSLTLLIPSMGVTKGLSYLGKAKLLGTGKSIGNFTRSGVLRASRGMERLGLEKAANWLAKPERMVQGNLFLENGLTAALSRTMENYQESRQTYNDMYDEVKNSFNEMKPEQYADFIARNKEFLDSNKVDVNNKDEVAKVIAKTSADRTFALDWSNVVFDIYQMYALRNVLSYAKNFRLSPKTRRTQRESIRYAGMTEEEKAAAKAAESKWQKFTDTLGDYTIGGANMIKASASEGVEEAINYIAQQEGTHLGKYLLTGEGYDEPGFIKSFTRNDMYSRIAQDYVKNPALWDSAFWGVLGGVVFEGLGSGFKRIEQTAKRKQDDKRRAENETTKEQIKKPNWWELDEMPETQRMISDIQAREQRMQMFAATDAMIRNGNNPYDQNQQNGSLTAEDKKVLRDKAQNEYIDELIINARNNGTLDMLMEYLRSDNVKKAFEKAGLTQVLNEEGNYVNGDATVFQQKVLEKARRINDMYDAELTHVSNIAAEVNRKTNTTLPVEYLQIIASNNVRNKLGIESLELMKSQYEAQTNEIESLLSEHKKSLLGYRELVKLQQVTRTLADLNAQKKELEEEAKTSIDARQSLEYVNKQIDALVKSSFSFDGPANIAKYLYAMSIANGAFYESLNDKKVLKIADDALSNANAKMLSEGIASLLPNGVNFDATQYNVDDMINQLAKVDADLTKTLGDESELAKISPDLPTNYATLAAIDQQIALHQMDINHTEDEVMSYINFAHNTISEARRRAIRDASKTLTDIQRAHKEVNLAEIVDTIYASDQEFNEAAKALSEDERTQLKDALDILNVANKANAKLYDNIKQQLFFAQLAANQETQNNLGNQNASSQAQSSGSNNVSQQPSQTNTGQNNGQNQPQNSQQSPQTTHTIQSAAIAFTAADEVLISNTTNGVPVIAAPSESEVYELDVTSAQQLGQDVDKLTSSDKLFDIRHQPIDGGVITKNPIIRNNNGEVEVISKGIIENPQAVGAGQSNNSSTGGLGQTSGQQAGQQPAQGAPQSAQQPATQEPETPKLSSEDTIIQLAGAARDYVMQVKNGVAVSYEGFKQTVQNVIDNSEDPAAAEDMAKRAYDSNARRAKKKYSNLVQDEYNSSITEEEKSIDNLIDEVNSSITETFSANNKVQRRFKKSFEKALEDVVKDYLKNSDIKKIDGKYLINLENLLRYTNGFDTINATLLYQSLIEYLNSDTAAEKYIVTDKENFNSPNFLSNANKTISERLNDGINNIDHRINTTELDAEGLAELDNCEIGDELTLYANRNQERLYFKHNGITIGYIGIPRVTVDGTYKSVNMGWVYDITPNGKDKVTSKIRDAFVDIATSTESDQVEINKIVTEFAFAKPTKDRKEELLDKLKNNAYWQSLSSMFQKNTDDELRVRGLASLWRYNAGFANTSTSLAKQAIEQSINTWFNNVLNEYITAAGLLTSNEPVTIGNISDGALIRFVDRVNPEDVDKLPVVSEAIGDKFKGKISLGVGSREVPGTITTSANPSAGISNINLFSQIRPNNTVLVIAQRNGRHGYVQAYPVKLKDIKNETIKEIIKAVDTRIDQIVELGTNGRAALNEFLFNLFDYNQNTTLFNISSPSINNFGGLNLYKDNVRFNYFPNTGNLRIGNTQLNILDNKEEFKKALKDYIHENAAFNITELLIKSDNNKNIPLGQNSFVRRTNDGKLEITIPGTPNSFVFDSYSDFILGNDLVRVNTKANENGSNFTRNPANQAGNPVLRYKTTITSPVEESTDSGQQAASTTNDYTQNSRKALDIINDSSIKNKGEAIAKLIFDDETMKPLIKLGLLPSNIVYDKDFNSGANRAGINASTAISGTEFGRVKFGPKLLRMLSSPDEFNRKQAIRKLIHERLHAVLHTPGNERYLDDIKEIYNEFIKYNEDNNAEPTYRKYEFEGNPDAIEEFLVESLTSVELANYLNGIQTTEKINMRVSKRDTLLNKIMRFLAKLMGVKINNQSLYAKEFEAFRNVMQTTPQQLKLFNAEEVTAEQIEETNQEQELEGTNVNEEQLDAYDNEDDELDDIDEFNSSVTEGEVEVSSIADYINSLPFERQAIVARKINSGDISVRCK